MRTTDTLRNAVIEYKNGNTESFNQIYSESYGYLHTCAIHIVKDENVAMDMVQEAYMEIVKNISQLENPDTFLSWAATITNRKCFAQMKKNRDILVSESTDEDQDDYFENIEDDVEMIPEEVLQNQEKCRLIKEIIDDLSDMQRLCVIGFYYNEQRQEEIAAELSVPVNTVKSHLNRAKSKIKEAVVDLETKKGTKLYSIAPFMLLFLTGEAKECMATPMSEALVNTVSGQMMQVTSGAAGAGNTAAQSASSANAAAQTAKVAGTMAKGKLIGMVAAIGGVCIIGGAAVFGIVQANKAKEEPVEIVEEDTDFEDQEVEEELEETTVVEDEEEKEVEEETSESTDDTGFTCLTLGNEYENIAPAYAGMIPVKKDGYWGAINYENEEIIPCTFTGLIPPTKEGYIVFMDGSYSYLYDAKGNEIMSTPDSLCASENYYIVTKYDEADPEYSTVEYYTYDGELVLTIENTGTYVEPSTSYDGKTFVYQYTHEGDTVYENTAYLDENQNLFWNANPLYKGPYFTTETLDSTEEITGNAAATTSYLGKAPVSAINHGYFFVCNKMFSPDVYVMYNQDNEKVGTAELNGGTLGYYYMNGGKMYNLGSKYVVAYDDHYELKDCANGNEVIASYAYIELSDNKYLLASTDSSVSYIDESGNEIATFDRGSSFVNGYALVMEDGKTYIINEDMEKVEEVDGGENVTRLGEQLIVIHDDYYDFYYMNK